MKLFKRPRRQSIADLSKRLLAGMIAATTMVAYTGISASAFTINAGETMTVESTAGSAYNYSTAGNIIINGTLEGFEKDVLGGSLTGNGAGINLTSTAGTITIGSTGRIIINGTIIGGNGGILVLDASSIFIDGIIQANGLGSGGIGGSVILNTDMLNLASTASISALSGAVNNYGGKIDINSNGLVTISDGAVLSTKGRSGGGYNNISIVGTGVNIGGQLNAQSRGTYNGGTIDIEASTGTITILPNGTLIAAGHVGNDGGTITLTGDVHNQGILNAASGSGNRTGGSIIISGTSGKNFTQDGNGRMYAMGHSGSATSNGGTIQIITGSVDIDQSGGGIKIDASGSKLATGNGNGGNIEIRATNGDLEIGRSIMRNYGSGGSIYFRSNTGALNVGRNSNIVTFGDSTNTLTMIGNSMNVDGLLGAEGHAFGDGGTMDISVNNGGDFNLTSNGYLSTRGSQFDSTETGSHGGTINLNSTGDINLSGNAKMRAYGTQYKGNGTLGNGGVINLDATGDYTSGSNIILNAGGARVSAGSNITRNVIDITANNMDVDGRYLAHGRQDGQDGGRITFTANNALTLASTASLEAWGDLHFGGAGGQVYLNSTNGNVTLNNAFVSAAGIFDNIGGLINVAANNGTFNMGSGSIFDASGQSQNIANNGISISGGRVNVDGTLNASSNNYNGRGGAGGSVRIASTSGDITLSSNGIVNTQGYANNDAFSGNSGDVTISSAGNFTQDEGIILTSVLGGNAQGLNGENDAGDVDITAGGNVAFYRNGATLIDASGISYNSGGRKDGGDGGNIVVNSGGTIQFWNPGGGTDPLYMDLSGGDGQRNRSDGGAAGSISLNGPGSKTMQGLNTSDPYLNLNILGGSAGGRRGNDGAQGNIFVDGGIYY